MTEEKKTHDCVFSLPIVVYVGKDTGVVVIRLSCENENCDEATMDATEVFEI